jgi:hypothetical protein
MTVLSLELTRIVYVYIKIGSIRLTECQSGESQFNGRLRTIAEPCLDVRDKKL